MDTKHENHQFGQGSNDDRKNQAPNRNETQRAGEQSADNDGDFLGGDNQKRAYPNNQNNPNPDYNQKSVTPGRGSNPNIGGDESEYETSTNDEDGYDEGYLERRDSEEINRHEDENRYSSPTTRNRSEE